jgi:phage-related protein
MRDTRPISWLKGARKDFEDFPRGSQTEMAWALTILAEGEMPDIAKPLTGLGSGVMELALGYRGMPSGSSTRCKSATTFG